MNNRILLVDDDEGISRSLAELLTCEGYCVDAVTDSGKAAILIKKERYDVVLFDYKMQGLNGIDLLKLSKKVNPGCHVFIISGMLDIEHICQKGCNPSLIAGILRKPFDIDELLQKIENVIE